MAQTRYSDPFPPTPQVVYTSAAWWVALSPVWIFAVSFIMGMALPASPLTGVVLLACVFLSAGLTMHDRKVLLQSGYHTAASTWWWLLTPLAYFIARGVHVSRVTGRGWATAVVFGCTVGFSFLVQLTIAVILLSELPS